MSEQRTAKRRVTEGLDGWLTFLLLLPFMVAGYAWELASNSFRVGREFCREVFYDNE